MPNAENAGPHSVLPNKVFSRLLNALYPSRCPSCSRSTDTLKTAPFCRYCWSQLTPYAGPKCEVCWLPFASHEGQTCADCLRQRPFFSYARSFGIYEGSLASAIHLLKFQGIRRLSGPLASLLLELGPDGDAVAPIPLTPSGMKERGFNQSLLLAAHVAKKCRIPLLPNALSKIRETRPQVGLPAKERRKNLRGAYRASAEVSGKKVMLIDDVMTTGATVNECARELLLNGAEEVRVFTLARAATL